MFTWLAKLFRVMFALIDNIIYGVVNRVYQLFIMISETGIFTPETIKTFAGRIYVLLGVFMLFKVSFSLITYILNPDDLTDKSKGVSKLLTNFFVVLVGIVAVPYVFQAAYGLQAIVLKDNIIGNLVMGMNSDLVKNTKYNYVEQGGRLMSYTTMSAFITLNEKMVGVDCASNPVVGAVDTNGEPLYDNDGTRQATLNSACDSEVFEMDTDNGGTIKSNLIDAYTKSNAYYLTNMINLRADNKEGNEDWVFDYNFIISSIAGGFLAWILLLFCIDVAVRSVKLSFLQLIAPIPIISYIDPKSGKDGMFKKWTKECTTTYLDLFTRLIAIYFAVFVISSLVQGRIYNVTTGATQKDIFVMIFIIFGALMFAHQLPNLIKDITGANIKGGFTLNPMKKLGESPYAAGLIGTVGGFAGGMAANAWAAHKNGDGFVKGLGSSFAGGVSSGFKGGKIGLTSGGKSSAWAAATKGITESSRARNLRDKGYGTMDKVMDKVTDIAGVKYATGTTSALKSKVNQAQQELANFKRNEQSYSDELSRKISSTGRNSTDLLKTFDGAGAEWDSKGNLTEYEKKTFEKYATPAASKIAARYDENWDELNETRQKAYFEQAIAEGAVVDRDTFASLNSLYEARNKADIDGRIKEKEINDLQDDMGKFKDRKK